MNSKAKLLAPVIDVKKYGGKQVAILNGKVVASGSTLRRVLFAARKRAPFTPLHEIQVFSVPKTLSVIYYAS